MKTYQELEKQAAESKIEFESLLFQMDEMIEKVEEMQKSIISLKEYLKGSVFFPSDDI
jgi:uncharacterized coiled-coil protein SlyX